jgi:hypothetical protein
MKHPIKSKEDLRWLLGHTGGFRGGYVTDVQMSKRRLYDEGSGRDVLTDTIVSVVIRYRIRQVARVAKLTMQGVTDFSIFEQEGADCSTLSIIQAEATAGKFRFWFDPQGELYVVCDEAELEEVAMPLSEVSQRESVAQWSFHSEAIDWPTADWLLGELDRAGLPCAWRGTKPVKGRHPAIQWEGDVVPTSSRGSTRPKGIHVMLYGVLDGPGFGLVLRVIGNPTKVASRVLSHVADVIVQHYAGQCLVGNTIIPGEEWLSWKLLEQRRWVDA